MVRAAFLARPWFEAYFLPNLRQAAANTSSIKAQLQSQERVTALPAESDGFSPIY
jgi:hypothetical protein